MIAIVAIMLATHFLGVILWAGFYFLAGILTSVQEAMLFSMLSYTTIGSPHTLRGHWEGFGGFEAMTGMLMFGWSTAVLAAVVQKIHAIEESQRKKPLRLRVARRGFSERKLRKFLAGGGQHAEPGRAIQVELFLVPG